MSAVRVVGTLKPPVLFGQCKDIDAIAAALREIREERDRLSGDGVLCDPNNQISPLEAARNEAELECLKALTLLVKAYNPQVTPP